MLILCEQMKKAYNSEYFLYYEIRELSLEYIENNPEQRGYPFAIIAATMDDDDFVYVLGSYSTLKIVESVFVEFLEHLADNESNIVNLPTEEHYFEKLKTLKNAGFTTDIIGNPF